MPSTASALRPFPLFRDLSDAHLGVLAGAFAEKRVAQGEVVFREGDLATKLQLLVEGEVELREASEPKLVIRAPAVLGELGALTGLARNSTAVANTALRLLEIETQSLTRVFDTSPDLALAFYRRLLGVVAVKVGRDRVRMQDMRANIVRTQKRMKEMRELILASVETPLSQPLAEILDALIENNRRAHYRVAPVPSHPSTLRLDDREVAVVELSDGYLKLAPAAALAAGTEVSAVLVLPQGEYAISGKVARVGPDGVLIKLDLLIDEYQAALSGYMTQLQLFDFVV